MHLAKAAVVGCAVFRRRRRRRRWAPPTIHPTHTPNATNIIKRPSTNAELFSDDHAHAKPIRALSFSRDGAMLLTAGDDKAVRLRHAPVPTTAKAAGDWSVFKTL